MKIVWLCNCPLESISRKFEDNNTVSGGWLTLVSQYVSQQNELHVLFPNTSSNIPESGCVEGINYTKFDVNGCEIIFHKVIREINPDVVHIRGTEFEYQLKLFNVCEELGIEKRVVVEIQGLVHAIAKHYDAGIPQKISSSYTIRDFIKRDNIRKEKENYYKRGKSEIELLQKAQNVIGRTEWDFACAKRINPCVNYYHCNETLRESFYHSTWDYDHCEPHSIFVSQSNYPVKGFHYMLEAMRDVVKKYPDAVLYTTGINPLKLTFRQKILQTSYMKYIGELIKKYSLQNNVVFLGKLNEIEMKNQYLKSNVFVCCSTIENSSNSLGEAMLLGVPVVTAGIGGVLSMIKHEEEGYIYQSDAPYMLSFYIEKIFENLNQTKRMCMNAKSRALITHDRNINFSELEKVYRLITSARN